MRLRRMDPGLRAESLLPAAIEAAKRHGFLHVTRAQIADQAGCSAALVSRYFGTMPDLRRTIMRYAVKHEVVELVAQGLAAKHPHALRASEGLRQRVAEYFKKGMT